MCGIHAIATLLFPLSGVVVGTALYLGEFEKYDHVTLHFWFYPLLPIKLRGFVGFVSLEGHL